MLEIVYGETRNQLVAGQVADSLSNLDLTGTLYIGYPVLAMADETIVVDALLICREHGLVAFVFAARTPTGNDIKAWHDISRQQDRLFIALKINLSRHEALISGRELAVEITAVTVFPTEVSPPAGASGTHCGIDRIAGVIRDHPELNDDVFRLVQAALQRVTSIKPPKKRTTVERQDSRGHILKEIERQIANLDQWQKKAAIETPDGPQRIRGLAGSGKTVVLALKAAYLHAQHPEWKIVVTFHTRSLYQQFRDLISRFTFEHLNDQPNWNNLLVIHSWGGRDQVGVYTQIARLCDVTPKDFLYARDRYGQTDAFSGVCTELLASCTQADVSPSYDAVLIDEAQDLPPAFFQLVYRLTKDPKRIIWAFDELQKLSEGGMPSTDELFGVDETGNARVRLANIDRQPRQDVTLPVCYRNTPWALTVAHALGMGIYRKDGLVQHFDDPSVWNEVGYLVVNGDLAAGSRVSLRRDPNSFPQYFSNLLNQEDAVQHVVFGNNLEQVEWVARQIQRNLAEEELEADDILVVLPDAYTARKSATVLMEALGRRGLRSHLAGVTTSRDELFNKDSVAIASIFRSKGNEAPLVYVLDGQFCYRGQELQTLRNKLFTAVTRSRAWVRLCGWGEGMEQLAQEIQDVRDHNFQLDFTIPTAEQLEKMRQIYRDRTADEKATLKKFEKSLKALLEAMEKGDLSLANLPPELRTKFAQLLQRGMTTDDNSP